MPTPTIIIISGPPCAGKTTMASRIAKKFSLPIISKDAIKENLFGTLGIGNREWSRKIGIASIMLAYQLMEDQLNAGRSFVTEMNFYQEYDTPRFQDFKKRFDVDFVQVHCHADTKVLIKRDQRRWDIGERHEGHVHPLAQEEAFFINIAKGSWDALNIDGLLIEVDTNDFDKVDYQRILDDIQSFARID